MKKLILIFLLSLITVGLFAQVTTSNIEIRKTTPILKLNGTGAVIDFYNNDVRITHSSNLITLTGGGLTVEAGQLIKMGTDTVGTKDYSRTAVGDSIAKRLSEAKVGLSLVDKDVVWASPEYVQGYIGSGGAGSFTGDIVEFYVGETTGAPTSLDSTFTHSHFEGKHLDLLRDGRLDKNNFSAAANIKHDSYRLNGTILTVNPLWQDGEHIEIRIREPITWNYLSIEGQESSLLTGLSAFYKCDEASGETVDDAMDIQDGKMWTNYTSGIIGKYNFGKLIGYRGVMSVSYNTNVSPKGTAYSVAMWVYLDTVANQSARSAGSRYYYLFAQQHSTASPSNYPHRLWIDGATADSNKVMFKTYNNAGTPIEYSVKSSIKLHSGQWYHIAAVNAGDGQSLKIYINGADVSASAGTFSGTVFEGLSTTRFGNEGYNYRVNLAGKMDDIGIWSKGLSPAEVAEEMAKSHPWE